MQEVGKWSCTKNFGISGMPLKKASDLRKTRLEMQRPHTIANCQRLYIHTRLTSNGVPYFIAPVSDRAWFCSCPPRQHFHHVAPVDQHHSTSSSIPQSPPASFPKIFQPRPQVPLSATHNRRDGNSTPPTLSHFPLISDRFYYSDYQKTYVDRTKGIPSDRK